jgi:hypothetical protein
MPKSPPLLANAVSSVTVYESWFSIPLGSFALDVASLEVLSLFVIPPVGDTIFLNALIVYVGRFYSMTYCRFCLSYIFYNLN